MSDSYTVVVIPMYIRTKLYKKKIVIVKLLTVLKVFKSRSYYIMSSDKLCTKIKYKVYNNTQIDILHIKRNMVIILNIA